VGGWAAAVLRVRVRDRRGAKEDESVIPVVLPNNWLEMQTKLKGYLDQVYLGRTTAASALPGWGELGCWRFVSAVSGGRVIATNTNTPYLIVGRRRFMPPVPSEGTRLEE